MFHEGFQRVAEPPSHKRFQSIDIYNLGNFTVDVQPHSKELSPLKAKFG
jgi:hypothetical protein